MKGRAGKLLHSALTLTPPYVQIHSISIVCPPLAVCTSTDCHKRRASCHPIPALGLSSTADICSYYFTSPAHHQLAHFKMGGSISLVNTTNLPLDISLDQLGPLYYENNVQPGSVFHRDTGEFFDCHFLLPARLLCFSLSSSPFIVYSATFATLLIPSRCRSLHYQGQLHY